MTTVRCYVPVSQEQLTRLHEERTLAGPLTAYAVTEAVRAAQPAGDDEEWEYTALQEAAAAQLADGAPVVVAAADLEADRVRAGSAPGARVEVGDVDLPRVAALHLGDDVVSGDRAALAGEAGELELSWYDTTELAHVLELARALGQGPASG